MIREATIGDVELREFDNGLVEVTVTTSPDDCAWLHKDEVERLVAWLSEVS